MMPVEAITLAIAVLGAVLGLLNTWHQLDRSRVKLRVRPKHAISIGGVLQGVDFCIEVTNLSAFEVTISEAGLLYRGTDARGCMTAPPILIDGGKWPRRLPPRSSVTVYGHRPTGRAGPAYPVRLRDDGVPGHAQGEQSRA